MGKMLGITEEREKRERERKKAKRPVVEPYGNEKTS